MFLDVQDVKLGLCKTALFALLLPSSFAIAETVEVIVSDYRFQPPVVQIKTGDTVKWVNREKRTSHSVAFAKDQGGESERFFPDESFEKRFDKAGKYSYHCGPHPEMTGVVEVLTP